MSQLFNVVFKPDSIYNMLFFNVKTVLKYPTLSEFEEKDVELYKHWVSIAKQKYGEHTQDIYEEKAPYFSEFTKIITITYATLYLEDGVLKRYMKRIVNDDEFTVLLTFMDELWGLSGDDFSPKTAPILCGHNIIGQDIPLLMKKFIQYRGKFERGLKIPEILKYSLDAKPWESGVVDTLSVWKFNGYGNTSLSLISDYLGLKKTVDLLSDQDASREYWKLYNVDDNEKALKFISLQSATQTNMVIQLMNEMRQL